MQKIHVASGTYFHGNKQATLINACLGTCVGVALFDKEAAVGGIIHLLLPEPITVENTFQPEKYASNGLPLFLNALLEAGASKKNLRAWIAGGALVGPLMQLDLDMDIGGRTTEVARNILTAEGIAIEHVETGGFFACTLSLDMQSWSCAIEPSGSARARQTDEIATMTEAETLTAISRVQPIPQVALKILRMMSSDDFDTTRIAEEVRQDQVISALTLKVCNSAFFSRKKRIE
ncbi:MAG: HDOD domain-containing protein, partial [Desulfobacterales bacterium]|nr:HDOD domain-containing protein [Desulfobacterales bacterium]